MLVPYPGYVPVPLTYLLNTAMSSKPKQEGKTIVLKGQEGTWKFIFPLSYHSLLVAEDKVLEYMKQVKQSTGFLLCLLINNHR